VKQVSGTVTIGVCHAQQLADFMSAVAAFSSFALLTLQLIASYLSLNFMLHSPEVSRVVESFYF
jgi:hypothetical protein